MQSASISTEIERCSRGNERIRRTPDLTSMTVPSSPVKGPRTTQTLFPACTERQGVYGILLPTTLLMESISSSVMEVGSLAMPTIDITPGTTRTGSLSRMSILQNVYPGNSGASIVFDLSDHRRRDL